MNKRTNLRTIPNKDSFIKITDKNDRVWHFKVPSALQGMKVFKSSKSLIDTLSQIKGLDVASVLNTFKDAGPEVLCIFGIVIGISWFAEDSDLEAQKEDFKTLADYGEAVFEELHDADVELEDIILMATAIGKVWWSKNSIQEEAMNRLGFSNLMKDPLTSLSLTSALTTSEIPGDMTN